MIPTPPAPERNAHTPLPWKRSSEAAADEYSCVIVECSRSMSPMRIATTHVRHDGKMDYTEAETNAAFIVAACNAHSGLVADNERLRRALSNVCRFSLSHSGAIAVNGFERGSISGALRVALDSARAALAASGEKQTKLLSHEPPSRQNPSR